ncbi:hypothetical protein [Natrialba aegyptia]|uniref:DUF8115 domain-containing protein n=1 Tax=Natrialba aegyptia DSM 13077 TaxID=1227491 RepID=M0B668_9EURY|nr:hypothetical protein [Natrialba aegyptia]ELZ05768.1 hypothetical protein C480_10235 [Natrialba aegyptia DSM 13077]
MTDDQKKAEALLQGQTEQSRHETEPTDDQTDDELPELEDAIADAYEQIDDGDLSSNLTLRDENLAALFHGLEDADRLAEIGAAAAGELDRDTEHVDTRAATLRLLVRIGLETVDEDVIQAGKDGKRLFLESQTDEF